MPIVDANTIRYDAAPGVVDAASLKYDESLLPDPGESKIVKTLGDRLKARKKQFMDAAALGKDHPITAAPEQTLGMGAAIGGGIGDVIGAGAEPIIENIGKFGADNMPEWVKKGTENVEQTPAGKAVMNTAQSLIQKFYDAAKAHPRIARDVGWAGDIASLYPFGKGAKVAGAEAGDVLLGTSEDLASRAAKKDSERLLNTTKRRFDTLKPTEQKSLRAQGEEGVTREGKTWLNEGKVEATTTAKDKEVADAVKDIVKPKALPEVNISAINGKIREVAAKTEELPREFDKVYEDRLAQESKVAASPTPRRNMRTALTNVINNAKSKALSDMSVEEAAAKGAEGVLGTDKEIIAKYNQVRDIYLSNLEKIPNSLGSVFQARKALDKAMDIRFGPGVWKKDSILRRANEDIRRSINDFVEEQLPKGSEFKAMLRQQHLLFTARDNIVANTAKDDALRPGVAQKVWETIKKHPYLAAEAATTLGSTGAAVGIGGAFSRAVTSPETLTIMALYGGARIGQTLVQSPRVARLLSGVLKVAGNTLTSDERATIRGQIELLGVGALTGAGVTMNKATEAARDNATP